MNRLATFLSVAAGCRALLGAGAASAQDYLNPGNGHYYRLVRFPERTWNDAQLAAFGETRGGVNGHLATITSADEQSFVATTFSSALQQWGAWLGGFQPVGSPEPAGNWQWVTGEPFVYTNWGTMEPNNANSNENQLHIFPQGFWNDVGTSEPVGSPLYDLPYLVEFSIPEPSSISIALMAFLGIGMMARRRGRRG